MLDIFLTIICFLCFLAFILVAFLFLQENKEKIKLQQEIKELEEKLKHHKKD
jgi:cell division protein FtsL